MLSIREFTENDFYLSCKKEYENSRHYLKTCGKPKDWYEEWLIKFYKETCKIFSNYS